MQAKDVVLVTGASGFVGGAITSLLGDQSIGIVGPHSTPSSQSLACDLSNLEQVKKLAGQLKNNTVSCLIHAAAVTPWSDVPDFSRDLKMATSVAWLCKELNIPRLIFISGWNVYDMKSEPPFSERTPVNPTGEYGESKQKVEDYFGQNVAQTKLVLLRAASIYGPGQLSAGLIPNLVSSAFTSGAISIDSPETRRDYIYIDDFIDAIKTLINVKIDDQVKILNIGSGRSESVAEVAEAIKAIFVKSLHTDIEIRVNHSAVKSTLGDNRLSIEAAQSIGLLQHVTSLSEGLTRYIQWRKNENIL